MARQWYYVGNGDRKGPLDETAIAALVDAGVIRSDTLTWSEGMPAWAPAADSLAALFPRQSAATVFPAVQRQPQAEPQVQPQPQPQPMFAAQIAQPEPRQSQPMYEPHAPQAERFAAQPRQYAAQPQQSPVSGANYLDDIGMIEATKRFFANYTNFSGRSSRAEYWWSVLGIILLALVAFGLDAALIASGMPLPIFTSIFYLGTIIPNIAIIVRRLHDLNKSGWWYFILLVPLVGIILILVWFCTRGDDGPNQFG